MFRLGRWVWWCRSLWQRSFGNICFEAFVWQPSKVITVFEDLPFWILAGWFLFDNLRLGFFRLEIARLGSSVLERSLLGIFHFGAVAGQLLFHIFRLGLRFRNFGFGAAIWGISRLTSFVLHLWPGSICLINPALDISFEIPLGHFLWKLRLGSSFGHFRLGPCLSVGNLTQDPWEKSKSQSESNWRATNTLKKCSKCTRYTQTMPYWLHCWLASFRTRPRPRNGNASCFFICHLACRPEILRFSSASKQNMWGIHKSATNERSHHSALSTAILSLLRKRHVKFRGDQAAA